MPSPDMDSTQHSLQVEAEGGEGGEDDDGDCRGGLGWYMIPRAALRRTEHTCKRSSSLVEQPWRDRASLPERPGSQGEVHRLPEPYTVLPNAVGQLVPSPYPTDPTKDHSKEPPPPHLQDDFSSTSSTATLSTSRVRDWLERSPPSSNTSTQSGSSGSLLLTAANIAGLRLEGTTGVGRAKEVDTISLASSTHFTMVGGYGPARTKQVKRSICAKHSVSVLVITTCSLFLLGLTAAVYYIDMRTKAVKYYS